MTKEEAKEIFLDRGFINGVFDGDKWRQSVATISEWLKQEPCDDDVVCHCNVKKSYQIQTAYRRINSKDS